MKKQGWTVSNEGTLIEMKRTAGNKTIYVTFSARSPPSEEPSEEDTKKEEEEEIDDDFYEFTVYVQKDSAQNVVFADYITSKGQVFNVYDSEEPNDLGLHQVIRKAQKNYQTGTPVLYLWWP